jgi:hypothetical protein
MPLASPWIIGAKPRRVRTHGGMQPIIDAPGQFDGIWAGEFLGRRRAMGQDLNVDPGLVHLAQAQLADIIETLEHLGVAHAFAADELRGKLLVPVVLLQRDYRAIRSLHHDASPLIWMDTLFRTRLI